MIENIFCVINRTREARAERWKLWNDKYVHLLSEVADLAPHPSDSVSFDFGEEKFLYYPKSNKLLNKTTNKWYSKGLYYLAKKYPYIQQALTQ